MTVRRILAYPNARLRLKCEPITTFDDSVAQLATDLLESLYAHADAGGLASAQIDVQRRMFIMSGDKDRSREFVLVNPEILEQGDEHIHMEGCYSFPEIMTKVSRPHFVRAKFQTVEGEEKIMEFTDWEANCVHHEIDHLDGILMFDRLSSLQKKMFLEKYRKVRAKIK